MLESIEFVNIGTGSKKFKFNNGLNIIISTNNCYDYLIEAKKFLEDLHENEISIQNYCVYDKEKDSSITIKSENITFTVVFNKNSDEIISESIYENDKLSSYIDYENEYVNLDISRILRGIYTEDLEESLLNDVKFSKYHNKSYLQPKPLLLLGIDVGSSLLNSIFLKNGIRFMYIPDSRYTDKLYNIVNDIKSAYGFEESRKFIDILNDILERVGFNNEMVNDDLTKVIKYPSVDGRKVELPIDCQGSGFKKVILLVYAMYLSTKPNNLVLIKDFDSGLHPILVRALLFIFGNSNFFKEKKSKVITTIYNNDYDINNFSTEV